MLNNSYDDFEQEDLMKFTAGRPFQKQDMDMNYQTDMGNYPDGKFMYMIL